MPRKKKQSHKPAYYTVGVRFLSAETPLAISKVYTYKVHSNKQVHLGQELVAETLRGPALVAVVRIDKTRQDTGLHEYKYLTRKVTSL